MRVTNEIRELAARIAVDPGLRNIIRAGKFDSHIYVEIVQEAFKAGMEHAERIWRSVQYSPAPYTDGKAKLAQAIRDASDD